MSTVTVCDTTPPAGITPAIRHLLTATNATPVSILAAKQANSHREILRAVCQTPGQRSREAHLRHVAACLAYTDDPICVGIVVEECGSNADVLAVACMAINRGSMRNALPRLFNRPEAALAIGRLGNRISHELKPRWQDFLKPRKCLS